MDLIQEVSNYTMIANADYIFSDFVNTPVVGVVLKLFNTFSYSPWIFSLIGSILVGLSGVFPLLVIRIEEGENLKYGGLHYWDAPVRSETTFDLFTIVKNGMWKPSFYVNTFNRSLFTSTFGFEVPQAKDGANRLRVLLSFAVGGLLGDVFLHLLPEAWGLKSDTHSHPSLFSGVWVLIGMLIFVIVEKLSTSFETEHKLNLPMEPIGQYVKPNGSEVDSFEKDKQVKDQGKNSPALSINNNNSDWKWMQQKQSQPKEHYHISGYLNLMANSVDNFTHGLAIGGSFSISFKMGVLSTFAILVHELPHEVGDFAILLKSGFSRWDAAKAQICTAFAGIMGSMFAVIFGATDAMESKTSWILPFTAGGFLHIALVTVLPELVHEESKFESCKQLGSLVFGIAVMAFMIAYFE